MRACALLYSIYSNLHRVMMLMVEPFMGILRISPVRVSYPVGTLIEIMLEDLDV